MYVYVYLVKTSFRKEVVAMDDADVVGIDWSVSFAMRLFSSLIFRNLSSQLLAYGLIFTFFNDADTSEAICYKYIIIICHLFINKIFSYISV